LKFWVSFVSTDIHQHRKIITDPRKYGTSSLHFLINLKDRIKEKLEKLRLGEETANARAIKAEAEVTSLNEDLMQKENSEASLNNRVSLLQMDLERQEKRVEEMREKYARNVR
jgi:predicted nuclease with TOPRIM domain